MKLFLASLANQTLDLITPLLPTVPNNLRIAFITTAADSYPGALWVIKDREKMNEMSFSYTDYDIKGKDQDILFKELMEFDIIFVTGGNTFYLLYHAKQTGFDKVLPKLIDSGKIYVGSSAGSCIMSPTIEHVYTLDHPEQVPQLKDYRSLGLVEHLIVPHFGREKYASRHEAIKREWGNKVTFLTDSQAIIVDSDKTEIVENSI